MRIVGFEPESYVDYPGKCCTVLYLPGCNFRCGYCFNPGVARDHIHKNIELKTIFRFIDDLNKNIFFIEAITISGGEPTLHPDLLNLCKKIRRKGLKIKLDTNGTNSRVLLELINKKLVDYIAMDFKYIPAEYEKVAEINVSMKDKLEIANSVTILKSGIVDYEFRTTLVPGLHNESVIKEMGEYLRDAERWYLQNFSSGKKYIDKKFEQAKPFSKEEIETFIKIAKKNVKLARARNL
jgi:pyruvate formate lyase activating enzyme